MTVNPSVLLPPERIALLDEVYQPLRAQFHEGQILVGGEEAQLLWEATVDCFAQGIWVATLLCAQATCERTLAGIISLGELPGAGISGPKGWERQGLGALIGHVRQYGHVPADVLDAVEELCETRKPYGHWRLPFDPGTIGRAVADALMPQPERSAGRTRCTEALLRQLRMGAVLGRLGVRLGDPVRPRGTAA
jgi:hypothetical protein